MCRCGRVVAEGENRCFLFGALSTGYREGVLRKASDGQVRK
jgi:hypothetical protein